MKHIIYYFAFIALFTACKQNVKNEVATEEAEEVTAIQLNTDSAIATINEPTVTEPAKLELTPLGNSGDFEPVDGENYVFSKKEKIIIEFNETIPTDLKISGKVSGKIIINGKTYKLNKSVRVGDSGYTISGDGVVINIPTIKWLGDDDGGDCQEGKVPTIKISLDDQELELKNIKVNYCVFG